MYNEIINFIGIFLWIIFVIAMTIVLLITIVLFLSDKFDCYDLGYTILSEIFVPILKLCSALTLISLYTMIIVVMLEWGSK